MKRMVGLLVASVLVLGLWQARGEEKPGGKSAEEVKKVDQELCEAFFKKDWKMFEKHLADDYVLTDPVGQVWDKEKNLHALTAGTLTFDQIKDSDVKVRTYGDAAVVTGESDIKGKTKTHEIHGMYRWTRVYVKREGDWKLVAEQLTRIRDKEEKKIEEPKKDK